MLGVKKFSVGICDGAPWTARSAMNGLHVLTFGVVVLLLYRVWELGIFTNFY